MGMDGHPLRKMQVSRGPEGSVAYTLHLGGQQWHPAEHIGERIGLRFTGARSCTVCGIRVKKFYGQGTCFPCFRDAPEASPCIVRPELCRAHLGEGRDPEWERAHHAQEHCVYLARTGGATGEGFKGLKVGVTRSTQLPTRWIDQGAVLATVIARLPYRQLAGAMEVDLKRLFSDRTDWRAMLRKVEAAPDSMASAVAMAGEGLQPELRAHFAPEEPLVMEYPGAFPMKVASVGLERDADFAGTLVAVKGQYLGLADGRVLNLRNHSGFHVELDVFSPPA